MPAIQRIVHSPYPAKALYTLVNDIKCYPQYLPWCHDTIIHHEDEHSIEASIVIKKGWVQQSFTTKNTLHPPHRIDLQLIRGPFQHLSGFWQFDNQANGGTQVTFSLDYTFENRAHALLLDPIFKQVADLMVEKFIAQAHLILG